MCFCANASLIYRCLCRYACRDPPNKYLLNACKVLSTGDTTGNKTNSCIRFALKNDVFYKSEFSKWLKLISLDTKLYFNHWDQIRQTSCERSIRLADKNEYSFQSDLKYLVETLIISHKNLYLWLLLKGIRKNSSNTEPTFPQGNYCMKLSGSYAP